MKVSERLVSLDVFRGITIAGMILVNNPGSWKYVYPPLLHAEWNGCTPTDLIFPFFLFIVGVSINYSLSKRKEYGADQTKLIINIFRRGITLFLLGFLLHAIPNFDFSEIRIPGVLQRIAVVYIIASIIYLKTNFKVTIHLTWIFLVVYWGLMTLVPVPGVGAPNLEPTTNLSAWLDNYLLGGHLWKYTKVWDPEGILSTLPAISTTLLGILTGYLLKSEKSSEQKTIWLFVSSSLLMLLGYVWDGWFPMNKSLWTSSYVVYTAGLGLNFLAICYWFIDIKKIKWWTKPFLVYGMNAITVFFLSSLTAKLLAIIKVMNSSGEEVSLQKYIYESIMPLWLAPQDASLIWAIGYVVFWLGLMWILYVKKIFIKV